MYDDDHMEMGDTGWVPKAKGWFYNATTGHWRDENGVEYDKFIEPLNDDDDYRNE